jgi:hypothetical protein
LKHVLAWQQHITAVQLPVAVEVTAAAAPDFTDTCQGCCKMQQLVIGSKLKSVGVAGDPLSPQHNAGRSRSQATPWHSSSSRSSQLSSNATAPQQPAPAAQSTCRLKLVCLTEMLLMNQTPP